MESTLAAVDGMAAKTPPPCSGGSRTFSVIAWRPLPRAPEAFICGGCGVTLSASKLGARGVVYEKAGVGGF